MTGSSRPLGATEGTAQSLQAIVTQILQIITNYREKHQGLIDQYYSANTLNILGKLEEEINQIIAHQTSTNKLSLIQAALLSQFPKLDDELENDLINQFKYELGLDEKEVSGEYTVDEKNARRESNSEEQKPNAENNKMSLNISEARDAFEKKWRVTDSKPEKHYSIWVGFTSVFNERVDGEANSHHLSRAILELRNQFGVPDTDTGTNVRVDKNQSEGLFTKIYNAAVDESQAKGFGKNNKITIDVPKKVNLACEAMGNSEKRQLIKDILSVNKNGEGHYSEKLRGLVKKFRTQSEIWTLENLIKLCNDYIQYYVQLKEKKNKKNFIDSNPGPFFLENFIKSAVKMINDLKYILGDNEDILFELKDIEAAKKDLDMYYVECLEQVAPVDVSPLHISVSVEMSEITVRESSSVINNSNETLQVFQPVEVSSSPTITSDETHKEIDIASSSVVKANNEKTTTKFFNEEAEKRHAALNVLISKAEPVIRQFIEDKSDADAIIREFYQNTAFPQTIVDAGPNYCTLFNKAAPVVRHFIKDKNKADALIREFYQNTAFLQAVAGAGSYYSSFGNLSWNHRGHGKEATENFINQILNMKTEERTKLNIQNAALSYLKDSTYHNNSRLAHMLDSGLFDDRRADIFPIKTNCKATFFNHEKTFAQYEQEKREELHKRVTSISEFKERNTITLGH